MLLLQEQFIFVWARYPGDSIISLLQLYTQQKWHCCLRVVWHGCQRATKECTRCGHATAARVHVAQLVVCVLVAVVASVAQRFSPGEPLASTMPKCRRQGKRVTTPGCCHHWYNSSVTELLYLCCHIRPALVPPLYARPLTLRGWVQRSRINLARGGQPGDGANAKSHRRWKRGGNGGFPPQTLTVMGALPP